MTVEQAMKDLVSSVTQEVVGRLAERYSFDAREALKALDQEGAGRPPSKLGQCKAGKKERITQRITQRITPSIPLPFCGVVNEGWCRGVRLNHGLHTQCTQPIGPNQLCRTCAGQAAKNGTDQPTYGRIEERLQHVHSGGEYNTWRDPSGKLVAPYSKIMTKLGITRSDAEAEAQKFGWTIPEQHFVVTERSAGRPKKSTAASDTESENGETMGTAKPRGRPRKVRVVESGSAGDDLIAQILANAQQAATESDEEVQPPKHPRKGNSTARLAVQLPDVAESLATVTLFEDDPDKCRLTALYAKYAPEKVSTIDAILAKRPPGSAARARMWGVLEQKYPEFFPKLAPAHAPADPLDAAAQHHPRGQELDSDSEEDVAVSEFAWEGRMYLRATDNVLYDPETQEEVGVWRESEQRIEELPASDFD